MLQSCSAQIISPLFPCEDVLHEPYGVTSHITREWDPRYDYFIRGKELQLMQEVGITNVRADLDYGTLSNTDKNSGETILKEVLNSTKSNDIRLLGIIKNVAYNNYNWNNKDAYNAYLDTLVDKYGSAISYWEYINEADLIKDQDSLADNYCQTLKIAYSKIKNKYPQCKVLYTGIAGAYNDFLENTFNLGCYENFDVMNFHCYRRPEDMVEIFEHISNVCKRYKVNKPVWLTECGLSTEYNDEKLIEIQAARTPRIFLLAFACGIEKVFFYNLRSYEQTLSEKEDFFGLLHNDLSPKPSFNTYKTLIRFCPSGSTRPVAKKVGNTYLAEWIKPDGVKVAAIWNVSSLPTPFLKITGDYKMYDSFGHSKNDPEQINENVTYVENYKTISFYGEQN